MAEQQIANLGQRAAPLTRVTKDSEEFELLAVNATFDGSAAATAYLPCVEVVSDAGLVVARSVATDTVAAGDSAEVTFAPFLGRKGSGAGIQFDVDNVGDWLWVETSSSRPNSGNGIDLQTHNFPLNLQTDNDFFVSCRGAQTAASEDWQIQAAQGGGGGTLKLDSSDEISMQALSDINIETSSQVVTAVAFNSVVSILTTGTTVKLPVGGKLEVQDSGGNPIFRVNENGDLQGKTGKALTFNL